MLATLSGCAQEHTTIELSPVPMPEGGSVYTVAVLDDEARLDVVAPSRAGLFVHRNDSGPWQRVSPRWPEKLPERHSAPLRGLEAAGNSLNFPHSEVFTAHEGRLWMVTGVPGPDGTKLMVSDNVGRTWRMVALPETVGAEEGSDDDAAPSATGTTSVATTSAEIPAAHVRLLNFGDEGLYLINATHLWKLSSEPGAVLAKEPWEPLELEGVEFETKAGDIKLPTVLRHYLPANEARPFELLTVLREKLFVYRRDGDGKWNRVATLPGADRDLVPIPGSDGVLMLTPQGLYRTSDGAQDWQPIELPKPAQTSPEGMALEVLPSRDEAPTVVLLSLDTGEIFRSVDLGQHWNEVRPADADRRPVTDFVHSVKRNRVWAASRGAGVLRSLDRGQTWHQINDELRTTRGFDMGLDDNGGFLIGTDAGLFRQVGSATEGHWQMLQDRATTTIFVETDSGAIINGTANGAIVRLEPDGKTTTAEAAPFDQLDSIAYRPMRFRGTELPPRSIIAIDSRPDSQHVFAWSAQEGPLMSLDGGISWTRLMLNPAFRSALEGTYLSNFTTDFGERMYLMTHSLDGTAPAQLWRSYNNGDTWHAVWSLPRDKQRNGVYVARSSAYDPEMLFMAHRGRFAKSLDGGNSWTDIPGPWKGTRVLAYNIDRRNHLLALDTGHTTSLLRVRETDEEKPKITSYTLRWPASAQSQRDDIRRVSLRNGRVYVMTHAGVLTGTLPDGQQRLPDGLAIIATIVSILVLTGIGFGILRWKA
ncbi:hypothetical protein FIV42_21440 [Persicimonas caeni]|uniref:Exo-alpha-sialidase n=1 Tax=Persicimonas caeni TaxID=2292766 RepID=A0A4Y6PY24_PERCE|nr:hypothetical protein [Persicimonas caeni]QDG53216.1 hypothetical protein FIV42_21440 [Persicimonas caeni]QED34438.1 hypothetical protein FRD00_21435 [Persicimonas caeni]